MTRPSRRNRAYATALTQTERLEHTVRSGGSNFFQRSQRTHSCGPPRRRPKKKKPPLEKQKAASGRCNVLGSKATTVPAQSQVPRRRARQPIVRHKEVLPEPLRRSDHGSTRPHVAAPGRESR